MAAPELKRVLKLPAITFIAVGFTIGGGVFVFTGIVFKIAGQALPVAYALAVVPVFISMLPIAMLGSAIPTTGANYKYPSRMVSPGLAFTGIWVYGVASFVGQIPLYALGCAKYLQVYFPGLSAPLAAVCILTFIFIINLLGVKLAAQIQGVFVIILIAALLYYSSAGLAVIEPQNFSNLFQNGLPNLLLGTALLTFTYVGANGIIELGGEIINPGKVIPAAFFIAFPIILIVYVLVAIATVGAVPAQTLLDSKEPLIAVSQQTTGKAGLFFFVCGGAILALLTTLNALFIVGTKSLLIIVQDGLLPGALGRLNRRFGTPHIFLRIIWLFSLAGIVSGLSLETLASYASLGVLIIFIPIQIAAIRLPKLYPQHYHRAGFKLKGFWLWFSPMVGILMVIFFSIIILYDLNSALKVGSFLGFILSGLAYYLIRRKYLQSKGFHLKNLRIDEATWDD
ncbi:MAG: amino acid permease [Deltaproteobacteria bacterium]|jgi:APA family basic amino acid/polyamine antiporter|nr:amino acid permease [Deltaproteobacteria bacterium]